MIGVSPNVSVSERKNLVSISHGKEHISLSLTARERSGVIIAATTPNWESSSHTPVGGGEAKR